jgi:hypothetical protein
MGSVAYDKAGDIAFGYSRSSAAAGDFPSIYYSGQTAGDPPGTTEPGALIKQGSGVQFSTASRSGDYSSVAVDGADGCTFWYATEYYSATGSFAWAKWLASLKFPNCQQERFVRVVNNLGSPGGLARVRQSPPDLRGETGD